MAASIVTVNVEPGTAAVLSIWRTGLTNADTVVDITIDPAMAGLSATAFTDGSGDDQGRINITVPDDAAPGSYTWSAEIDSVIVWTGQVFIEQNARNTSYVAHSPDIRSLTDPPFIIYRAEDLEAPDASGLPNGGTTGQALVKLSNDDGDAGWADNGTGDVSAAAAFANDNRLIRSDGTAKGVQASVVSLTDLGALSGITDISLSGTVDGRNVSADGTSLDNHLIDFGNPHNTTFVLLDDVPADYAGEGGKVVKVKVDETGLEFVAGGAGVSSFTDLDDVPSNYTGAAAKLVRVNATEDGLEFVTATGTGDVVGPASSTDNAFARFDLATGKLLQNSVVTCSDTGVVTGVDDLTLTGSVTMAALETVDGRDISVDGTALDALVTASANTVTASAVFTTDNRVLRSDGTGRGSQASTITVTDAGATSGITDLTITGDIAMSALKLVDGRDVSEDWVVSAAHFANTSNPHDTSFTLLTDVPISYTGAEAKVVRVNGTEDGLEFADLTATDVGADPAGTAATAVSTHVGLADPHTQYQLESEKGSANGYAGLDASGFMTAPSTVARATGVSLTWGAVTDTHFIVRSGTGLVSVDHIGAADPHAQYQKESEKASAGGYASLNGDVHVVQPALGVTDGTSTFTFGALVNTETLYLDGTVVKSKALPVGVADFTDLGDVPASYVGEAAKLVRVNALETGLEFVAAGLGLGDVVGPASATDEAFARFDLTTGKLLQDGPVKCTNTGVLTGIDDMTIGGSIAMSASETVDGRDISVDGAALDVLAAVAVTATATYAVDERLLRSDGTGRGSQASTIAVTDAGAVSGITTLAITDNLTMSASKTVDGRDVSVDGTALDALVTASSSYVTAASTFATDERILRSDGTGRGSQASALALTDAGALSGITDLTLTGDVVMSASKTVDGVDISALSTDVTNRTPLVLTLTADWTSGSTTFGGIAPGSGPTFTSISLVASKLYRLEVFGTYSMSHTTSTFQYGADWTNAPTAQNLRSSIGVNAASAQTWAEKLLNTDGATTDNSGTVNVANTVYPWYLDGVFIADSTPGTFEIIGRTRINSGSEVVTVYAGSTLVLTRLN